MDDAYQKGVRSQTRATALNPYPVFSEEWEDWRTGRTDAQYRAWRGDVDKPVWPWVVLAVLAGIALAALSAYFVYRVELYFF